LRGARRRPAHAARAACATSGIFLVHRLAVPRSTPIQPPERSRARLMSRRAGRHALISGDAFGMASMAGSVPAT
jgi:hypothetical protein